MGSYLDETVGAFRGWDDSRPRSSQAALGWSNMADCRRYMGFREAGDWPSDDEDNWRAIVGTVLHEFTRLRREEVLDDGVAYDHEVEVSYGGVPGHADEVLWQKQDVTDWKFPRLASALLWNDPDVLNERFIQGHGYAAGVLHSPAGRAYGWKAEDITVRMLVAPVDGRFDDWMVFERPFDQDVADRALDRLLYVREEVAAGNADSLPKDKPWGWCESVCEFFTLCRGADREPRNLPEILDVEIAAAIEQYGLAREINSATAAEMKALYPVLHGIRGKARGFKVTTGRQGEGKLKLHEKSVEQDYAARGEHPPYVQVPPSKGALRVIRI